jgi:hypothetical protein
LLTLSVINLGRLERHATGSVSSVRDSVSFSGG